MEHNISLMRRVYEQITRDPDSLNQGNWAFCVAGWAVRLHGEHGIIRVPGSFADGIHAVDFRAGALHNTDELAEQLLGLSEGEAEFLFVNADNKAAVRWLEDTIVHADMKAFELIAAGFDVDEWPIGRVIG